MQAWIATPEFGTPGIFYTDQKFSKIPTSDIDQLFEI
jgi:hypothetical protein